MRVTANPAFADEKYNPYQSQLYREIERQGVDVEEWNPLPGSITPSDVLHLHWPEKPFGHHSPVLGGVRLLQSMATIEAHRRNGARVIWTAHNLAQHEHRFPRLESKFRSWLVHRLDGIIYLSHHGQSMAERVAPALSSIESTVIPHGHYLDAYRNDISRESARAALGLRSEDRMLLFIGQIRPYKNVPALIRAFGQVPDDNLRLVVAGSPRNEADERELRILAQEDPRVILDLRFIANDEIQQFLNASDGVVVPYRDVFNSGTAVLALSFFRPMLAPAAAAILELQQQFGPEWVQTYEGDLTAKQLSMFTAGLDTRAEDPAILRQRLEDTLGWSDIASQTIEFYRKVLSSP